MPELILIVLVVVGLFWFAMRFVKRAVGRMATLSTNGHEAKGRVSKVQKERLSRTDNANRVAYVFSATDGIKYQREIDVLPSEFSQYLKVQPIDIDYDPRNPEVNMLKNVVDKVGEAKGRSNQTMAHGARFVERIRRWA